MHIVKTTIVGLIIAWGVLALAVRSATPLLGEYREQIAAYASEQLGTPVDIRTLEARWYGLRPLLELGTVTIGTEPERIAIQRVELSLALTDLLRGALPDALRITADGLELTAVRERNGQIHLQGLRDAGNDSTAGPLRLPSHLHLRDTRVNWIDHQASGTPLPIDDVNILLDRDDDGVRLRASLHTPAGSAQLAARLRGRLTDTDWSGDSYLRVDALDVARLFGGYVPAHYGLHSAQVDLQSWTRWEQATPAHSQGGFALSRIALRPPGRPPLDIKRLGGQFSVSRAAGSLQVGLKDLDVQTPDRQWPRGDLALRVETGADGDRKIRVAADYLRLDDLHRIVQVRPPSDALGEALAVLQPGGELFDLRLASGHSEAGLTWHARTRFTGLNSQPWNRVPGVTNLSGDLLTTETHSVLTLDSDDTTLRFARLFRDPLELPRIDGRVHLIKDADGWRLVSERLQADAAHLATTTRFDIVKHPGQALFIDLQSDFRDGDAAFARRYYPTSVMSDKLVNWLDRAIRSGHVIGGSALFYGPVDEFAFESSRSGSFQVVFDTEDLLLDYREGWPPLHQLSARAKFHGNQLDISASDGRIYDSRIEALSARIARLKPAETIRIRGQLSGPLQNTLRVLNEEALRERFGQFAQHLRGTGDSRVALDFTVPLRKNVDKYALQGRLGFDNNELSLPAWNFAMRNIAGELNFTLDGLQATGITATALGSPVDVDVSPLGDGSTRVRANGRFTPQAIGQVAAGLPLGIMRGSAAFVVDVDIPSRRAADAVPTLSVSSDLQGIAIDLPAPLGKSDNRTRDLAVRIPLGERGTPGSVRYGRQLAARFSSDAERVDVMLGGADATLRSERGIRIGGRLGELDVGAWSAALDRLPKDDGVASLPLKVEIAIGRVLVDTFVIDELELDAQRDRDAWRGVMHADKLAGRFSVPLGDARGTIRVDLERLSFKLPLDDSDAIPPAPDSAAGPDPATLPGLALNIADLRIGDAALGRLQFAAQPTVSGLSITQFTLDKGQLQLTADGNWARKGNAFATHLSGRASVADLGKLLVDLGYSQQLADAPASGEFLFDWPGNPAQLHRQLLQGKLHIEVDKGRLVELDPGVTRVVGLLNLNALTRRLKLDFTDFYKKGHSFDSITGDFIFAAGEATTDNLTMTGPTGRIEIRGSADLMARTLDQKVAVIPNLDATLPIAGTLAGGPVAGIAVLVAQQVLNKEVDKLNRFDYAVTGAWNAPKVTQLDSGGTLSKLLKPFTGGNKAATEAAATDAPPAPTPQAQGTADSAAGDAASRSEAPAAAEPGAPDPGDDAGEKKRGPLGRLIDMLKKGEPHGADFPGTQD